MYSLNEQLTHVPLTAGEVLEMFASTNNIPVAAEGHDQQETRAFFCSGNGRDGITAYVYLLMMADNAAGIYVWDEPISKSDYLDVRAAGLQFCESMGFMMEDWQMRQQTSAERHRMWESTNVFRPLEKEAPVQTETTVVEPQDEGTEEFTIEAETRPLPPDETILDLALDMSSTQAVYTEKAPPPPADEDSDPLEDKNFKVFLRLLTSA